MYLLLYTPMSTYSRRFIAMNKEEGSIIKSNDDSFGMNTYAQYNVFIYKIKIIL